MQFHDVRIVRGDVGEEDLLRVERDPLGTLELADLGIVLGQVLAVDLRRSPEGQVRDTKPLQPPRETLARVEADVVPFSPQPLGESRHGQEMTVERH